MESKKRGKYRYLIYLVFSGVMALNQIIRFIPNVNIPAVAIYRVSFVILFAVMITSLIGLSKIRHIDILFMLCGAYILLINLINGVGVVDSLVSICWPFAFIFGRIVSDWYSNVHFKKIRFLFFFLIVVTSTYAMYLNYTGSPPARTNIIGVNYIIYYGLPLLLVPYGMKQKNKNAGRYSTILMFVLWLALSIFSFKRTTLLAVVGGVVIFLYKKYFANKKLNNKFVFLLILLLMFTVAGIVNVYTGGYIIERLDAAEETGGNGRIEIWNSVISAFLKSNFVEKFFGNGGIDAVNATIGVSAHNEFLEILYDYGVFGVALISIALLVLCQSLLSKKVRKSKYAPLVWSTLFMIFVFSMFSHIFLYSFVSIPVFFFLGNLYSICRRVLEGKSEYDRRLYAFET